MGGNRGQTGRAATDLNTTLAEISALTNTSDEEVQATSLDLGYKTGCMLKSDGTPHCWGGNAKRQLGANSSVNKSYRTMEVSINQDVKQVSVGGQFSCLLLDDNTVKCAGKNISGQVGNGSTNSPVDPPESTSGLADITLIASGFGHSCAFDVDNSIHCWGKNSSSEISDSNVSNWSTPQEVYTHSGEGEGEGEMSTTIDGACPKMYTASQLSLDDIVDWNNVTFSNVDGNLSYNVDVEDKTVQVKFSNMDELFGSLAYSYSETIEGTTRSGSGSFLLTTIAMKTLPQHNLYW